VDCTQVVIEEIGFGFGSRLVQHSYSKDCGRSWKGGTDSTDSDSAGVLQNRSSFKIYSPTKRKNLGSSGWSDRR